MNPVNVHVDGLIYAKQAHGGISRNFTNLMRALAAKSDVLVNLHLERTAHLPELPNSLTVSRIPTENGSGAGSILGRLSRVVSSVRRRRHWRALRGGVFHSTYYSSPDGVRIPQVLTMQDTIFEDFPELFGLPRHLRHIEDKKRAFDRSAALIFSSRSALECTARHYRIDQRPVLVAPYAVDDLFMSSPEVSEVQLFRESVGGGRPFLLHIGSRYPHKNVSRLLQAYARWPGRADCGLLLAGGGELTQEELELVQALGVQNSIHVMPRLRDCDVLLAYHSARALVFPSLSEGFGFPVLEALACRCPVACSRAASLPEVGGMSPVYFDPTSVDGMVAALDELHAAIDDSSRWAEAQQRARSRSWSDVAAEYADFYRQVV